MRALLADKMFVREITNGARPSAIERREMKESLNSRHWLSKPQAIQVPGARAARNMLDVPLSRVPLKRWAVTAHNQS